MIQRIQTVCLLLTTILSVIFLNGHIIRFADGPKNVLYVGSDGVRIIDNTGGPETVWILVLLTFLILTILLISLITIFLYKKRKIQMKLSTGLIVFVCILILAAAYYYISVTIKYSGEIKPGINLMILPLMLLFSYLARRGIKRDEMLVKSYDRLR
jgi:hypothetical protein